MAARSDLPTVLGTAKLTRHGDIDGMAPEYPLERVCSHLYEPFQLKFARHAQEVLQESMDVQLEATHAGLVLRAETEAALESPLELLRDFYGAQIRIGPATIRYHRGVTLEQPYMVVRVRCRPSDLETVKADLVARQGRVVDSELTRSAGVVSAIAPARVSPRLLGRPRTPHRWDRS